MPLAWTDRLEGRKELKGTEDLLRDNIKMDLEEIKRVRAWISLICLRIETGVGLM